VEFSLQNQFSGMLQVGYFKYHKKRFGEVSDIPYGTFTSSLSEKRIHESKIVTRFLVVGNPNGGNTL